MGIRPAKKEPTMKKRAYSIVLAALVALLVASGASAKKADRYSAAKKADRHSVSKAPARHTVGRHVLRRSLRHA